MDDELQFSPVPEPENDRRRFQVGNLVLVQWNPQYGDSFCVYKVVDGQWYVAECTMP